MKNIKHVTALTKQIVMNETVWKKNKSEDIQLMFIEKIIIMHLHKQKRKN